MLTELLSGLRDEDLVRVVAGRAELVEARLPRRVAFTMRERLRSIAAPAREAATVAASLGRRFSFTALANMLDRSPAALLGPVEELIDSGVLVESGDRLAFRHDVTREAVRESVPVSARRALDRQAADVLLAAGAAPVEVAAQIAASAEPGDEQAISILLRAGEALATTDPGAGADLSRRALELAPRDHTLRGPLLAQSAVLLHSAGRVDEARAFADTHLRDALPTEQEAEVLLGIAGMFRVPPDARVAAGRQALALPELPAHLRAQHLAALFHNLLVGGRTEEAKAIRAETAAAVQGERGCQLGVRARPRRDRYRLSRRALRRRARDDRAGGARRHRHDRLGPRTPRPRSGAARRAPCSTTWMSHCAWPPTASPPAQRDRNALGHPHLRDLAGPAAAPAGPAGRRRRDPRRTVRPGDRRSLHRRPRRRRNRRPGASRAASRQRSPAATDRSARAGPARGQHPELPPPGGMAPRPAGHGRRRSRRPRTRRCVPLGEEQRTSILPLFPIDVTDEIPLVRIALAAGDDELAEVAAAQADRRAQLNPGVATIVATAAHVRGLLTSNIEELERAVELFATGPRPIVRGYALEDLGVARARAGAADAAIEAFDGALALFAEAGAAWDAGRVRGRLRDHGVRRRLVPRERAETGWEAMTDSELAVARLVAQGLTNREVAEQLFVSPHTVSSHLRSIFAKLEINSRLALARIAADHDHDA